MYGQRMRTFPANDRACGFRFWSRVPHFPVLIFKEEVMLVLSRKNRETVVVDGRITIKVLHIKGNTIRLGIEAPPEVSIRRGELTVAEGETAQVEILPKAPQIVSYTCAAS
jgi:carbon storage regulator